MCSNGKVSRKCLLYRRHGSVEALDDGSRGDIQGFLVGAVGVWGSAEDVAGELVEEKEQRERAFGGRGSAIEGCGNAGD